MQSADNKTLRVVQITDAHLFANPASKLNGLNTLNSLQQVLQAVINCKPDIIIFTGDLVDKPTVAAYQQVKAVIDQLPVPVYCLPGNHDQPEQLKQCLSSDNIRVDDSVMIGAWQLIFLNSYQAGTHSGKLDNTQLQMLNSNLSKHPKRPALICLHHHPVPIDSPWMDAMGLRQADDLFAVLDRYPQVKAVIWGHIHQQFEQTRNVIKLLGTPSTCIQFMPGATEFSLDDKPPGYRWLSLHCDGEIETGVTYLKGFKLFD
ncbi:MAG: 3',5'-cyclic-AMP phosphodiesterase [Methylococcales bacterium]